MTATGSAAGAEGPFDVLVLGSGVAGLSTAVRLAGLRVAILTKGELSQSATRWAQGGVAAVLGGDEDSTDLHLADTLAAGAGLCEAEAVRILVDEGPGRVEELIALGAVFDREVTGSLALAREGGHSRPRIVHAGGAATGAEVERALVAATRAGADAVLERWFALDLLVEGGRCRGVLALPPEPGAEPVAVRAEHVELATGGGGLRFTGAPPWRPPGSLGRHLATARALGGGLGVRRPAEFGQLALLLRGFVAELRGQQGRHSRGGVERRFTNSREAPPGILASPSMLFWPTQFRTILARSSSLIPAAPISSRSRPPGSPSRPSARAGACSRTCTRRPAASGSPRRPRCRRSVRA